METLAMQKHTEQNNKKRIHSYSLLTFLQSTQALFGDF